MMLSAIELLLFGASCFVTGAAFGLLVGMSIRGRDQ